jgi:hypothetical protein
MAAYRYPLPRRYRRVRYPFKYRKDGNGALPAAVIAGAVLLAGAGAGAKAATSPHGHARPAHKAAAGSGAVTVSVPVAGSSETAFISAALADLGAPDSTANQRSLASWFPHEYPSWPPWASNNPMSSTMPMTGSTAYNYLPGGGSVQNYPTAAEGAQATAATLNDGYYPAIVAALRSGGGICGGGFASELLTWSGNGYSEVC